MKTLILTLLLSLPIYAAQIFSLKNTPTAMSCQWYVPMTYGTEYNCQSYCHGDCSIIYGPNYTGHQGCVEQEFGYDCYCAVCY